MKIKFLKLKHWLIASLMGALGFSSCHSSKTIAEPEEDESPIIHEREEMRLMYGVPTMNYRISGQVRNAEGRPVGKMRVNMLERGMEVREGELQGDPESVNRWLEETAVETDKTGRFELKQSGLPQEQVRILVRDVDGTNNGEYRNQVIELDVLPDDLDRTGAGGWNQGTFNKEVQVKVQPR